MYSYVHLKFNNQCDCTIIKDILQVGNDEIPVSGKPGKWLTNLKINNDVNVSLKENKNITLIVSKEKLYHPDQLKFDKKYNIVSYSLEGETIYYSLSGERTNPKKVLITFAGISNFDNVNYRLSAMTSIQSELKSMLIIALQDKEGVYGNYMYKTSNDYPIKPIVISLICEVLERFKLNEKDIIFYGNSKGGTIALDYIEHFQNSKFFIDIPQLDLFNYQSQNPLNRYSLGYEARKYNDYTKKLPHVVNKNVFYSFAENDFDSSRGLPMKAFKGINVSMLKDFSHSGAALELVKKDFSKVSQFIFSSQHTLRKEININCVYKHNKLWISRTLGAFTDELQVKQVYAEIVFTDSENNQFAVSLNKKLIDKKPLIIYWQTGFDLHKHLDAGIYKISLHVYYKFKEYEYPIQKTIIVSVDNCLILDLSEEKG